MEPPDAGGADRAWRRVALTATALAHGVALGGALLPGDRLLLVRNPALHSFAGLGALLAEGRVLLRGAGLVLRDRSPVAAFTTWLSWEWFRGQPVAQHALAVLALLAIASTLGGLLRSLRSPTALAWLGALALTLHPCAADLTGPLLGRDALLALLVTLVAARRAREATDLRAVAWIAGGALGAGLCARGYGALGLVAAAVGATPTARRAGAAAAVVATVVALALTRGGEAFGPGAAAFSVGAVGALLGWLPSPAPFVVATFPRGVGLALVPALALAVATFGRSVRTADPDGAALLRAASATAVASVLAGAFAVRGQTIDGSAALLLQFSLVLAAVALVRPAWSRATPRLRPWMLVALALPAAVTAHRVRAWSDVGTVTDALVARDPDEPEALLARAHRELARRQFSAAVPWCLRYGAAMPQTGRADGCVGALAALRGDRAYAVVLLRRWAAGLGDRRALRAAALELSDAVPDPRLGEAFREATGYALPQRRPGEAR